MDTRAIRHGDGRVHAFHRELDGSKHVATAAPPLSTASEAARIGGNERIRFSSGFLPTLIV